MNHTRKKRPGRPQAGTFTLNAKLILDCAKGLMEREGKVPSIRKLAAELNIDPMAVYHYYKSKDSLVEAIAASLIDDIYEPNPEEQWEHEIHYLSIGYVELLSRYSGLLEILLSMNSHSPAEVFIEQFNKILAPLPLADSIKKNALDLLVDYLHGFSLAQKCNLRKSNKLNLKSLEGPINLFLQSLKTF